MIRNFSTRLLRQEIKLTQAAKEELKFQTEREHHAGKLGETWKKISFFFCAQIILGVGVNAYIKEKAHLAHAQKADVEYDYLFIRHKPFPWEGNLNLFRRTKVIFPQ